jgi:hypothetical protein
VRGIPRREAGAAEETSRKIMSIEEAKPRLSDRSLVFRLVERLNERATAARSGGGIRGVVGRAVNFGCARGFDLCVLGLLAIRRLSRRDSLRETARGLTDDAGSDAEKVERLCRFVYRNIAYARSTVWLKPLDVLRLGFGDCKCQAYLLWELLSLSGVEACIAVGITSRRRGVQSPHTWVETRLGEMRMICDPTFSPRAIPPDEYETLMSGILDVTPEYAMKRPDLDLIMRRM